MKELVMDCKKCGGLMIIDTWGGWIWTCALCDHAGRPATDEEIKIQEGGFMNTRELSELTGYSIHTIRGCMEDLENVELAKKVNGRWVIDRKAPDYIKNTLKTQGRKKSEHCLLKKLESEYRLHSGRAGCGALIHSVRFIDTDESRFEAVRLLKIKAREKGYKKIVRYDVMVRYDVYDLEIIQDL